MKDTSKASPDEIIAHVELLRAIDRLLTQLESVKDKRKALERSFAERQEGAER